MKKILLVFSIVLILLFIVVAGLFFFVGSSADCWVPGDNLMYKFIDSPENNLTCDQKVKDFIAKNTNLSLCGSIIDHYGFGHEMETDVARAQCYSKTPKYKDWTIYSSPENDFSFKYPGNIFKVNNDYTSGPLHLSDIKSTDVTKPLNLALIPDALYHYDLKQFTPIIINGQTAYASTTNNRILESTDEECVASREIIFPTKKYLALMLRVYRYGKNDCSKVLTEAEIDLANQIFSTLNLK